MTALCVVRFVQPAAALGAQGGECVFGVSLGGSHFLSDQPRAALIGQ